MALGNETLTLMRSSRGSTEQEPHWNSKRLTEPVRPWRRPVNTFVLKLQTSVTATVYKSYLPFVGAFFVFLSGETFISYLPCNFTSPFYSFFVMFFSQFSATNTLPFSSFVVSLCRFCCQSHLLEVALWVFMAVWSLWSFCASTKFSPLTVLHSAVSLCLYF